MFSNHSYQLPLTRDNELNPINITFNPSVDFISLSGSVFMIYPTYYQYVGL